MSHIDFNELFTSLGDEIGRLAKDSLHGYAGEARSDAEEFLEATKDDLKNWTIAYAQGKMSKEELKDLIKGKKNLMQMIALKQKGLGRIRIDKFRDDVIEVIVNTITARIF